MRFSSWFYRSSDFVENCWNIKHLRFSLYDWPKRSENVDISCHQRLDDLVKAFKLPLTKSNIRAVNKGSFERQPAFMLSLEEWISLKGLKSEATGYYSPTGTIVSLADLITLFLSFDMGFNENGRSISTILVRDALVGMLATLECCETEFGQEFTSMLDGISARLSTDFPASACELRTVSDYCFSKWSNLPLNTPPNNPVFRLALLGSCLFSNDARFGQSENARAINEHFYLIVKAASLSNNKDCKKCCDWFENILNSSSLQESFLEAYAFTLTDYRSKY